VSKGEIKREHKGSFRALKISKMSYMNLTFQFLALLNNGLTFTILNMKPQLKLIICIMAGTVAVSARCKAQPGASSHARHVIDSLKITDGDEIKICTLYDDVVSEYLKEWKEFVTNNKKPTQAQSNEMNNKFKQKENEIKPQVESVRKKLATNYTELMNFAQFCTYESMRVVSVVSQYQKGMYKGYPAPANH
jgi:hypothetical protein